MSSIFWNIIGLSVFFIHSFCVFKFAIPLLKHPTKKHVAFFLVPLINTCVFMSAYFLGFEYFSLYVLSYGMYMLFFKLTSKAPFRQILFGVSSYLINIASLHFLVIICTGAITDLSIHDIFLDTKLFFIIIAVTYTFLIGVLYLARQFITENRLVAVSTARGYSEIMGVGTSILFCVILIDSWVLINNPFSIPFFIASMATVLYVLIMYYCLFFVNTYILNLHPYKRKADEAILLRGEVLKKKKAAEYKLHTDDLTQLYNRRFIFHKLDELCESSDAVFGVIYADLTALKSVNDSYGHKVGDRYIVIASNAFLKAVREGDYCARVGGDEFVVILTDVTDEVLNAIVSRIKHLISEQNKKEKFIIHANLGYKTFNQNLQKNTRTEILEKVDELMKNDKKKYYELGGV